MFGLLWNLSAARRPYLRPYMPTNRVVDWLRTSRSLKWAVPGALIAMPSYSVAMSISVTLVRRGSRIAQRVGVALHLERDEVRRHGCLDSHWSVASVTLLGWMARSPQRVPTMRGCDGIEGVQRVAW